MDNLKLSEVIKQVGSEKGVDQSVLIETLEVALATAAKRVFGQQREIEAYYNEELDEVELFQILQVSEEIDNPYRDITLEDAIEHGFNDVGVGDELLVQIFYRSEDIYRAREQDKNYGDLLDLESAKMSFGRIAAQTAKQVILQRMREAEQDIVYKQYIDRKGELITGVVRRYEKGAIIVDLDRTDAVLPQREQTPRESYRPGDRIEAYVKNVQRSSREPQIVLSRTDPALVIKLFEQAVPEIGEGIVQILRVARQPGMRTKVAVYSSQNDVDPVGACVGLRGQRVQAVVQELRGEKIDIVPFNEEPARFVCSAISPAEVSKVLIDENTTSMELIVPDEQLSLAIGRGGQNVRLAAQLTGWNLDIISESRLADIMQEAKKALLSHGIEDESLIDTLFTLGYNKLEHIARVDPLELAQIPGFGMDNAERIVEVASSILAESQKSHTNKELEIRNISDIATYLGLTEHQARQVYEAGYKDLNILFLEGDPHRLDAKTGIGQNRAPELIEDLREIAVNQEVYSEDELAEAREIFDRSLKELPNCTLQQAYNCTVEHFGERPFPPEEDELDDDEIAQEVAEEIARETAEAGVEEDEQD
ncbi:MAG: transcription termination/antitermination protein NusA [Proteobacteria bacterium]|nr:transcription termination/antitermination protein NusA [Pseudomonadota bacterium]